MIRTNNAKPTPVVLARLRCAQCVLAAVLLLLALQPAPRMMLPPLPPPEPLVPGLYYFFGVHAPHFIAKDSSQEEHWLFDPLRLEHAELLLDGTRGKLVTARLNLEDVEEHGLGERAALAKGEDVTLLHAEARGAVSGRVLVALLETPVLRDVVEEITADGDGALHAGGEAHALGDAATDADVASERALFVDVGAGGSLDRGLEAKTNLTGEAGKALGLLAEKALGAKEDGSLLLESLLGLHE